MAVLDFRPDIETRNSFPPDKNDKALIVSMVEEITSGKKHKSAPAPRFQLKENVKREEILLLEDSPVMRNFYKRMLENNSFSVCTAGEEKSSVDLAGKNRPRLILIDDGGNARKALRVAKELHKDTRTTAIPVLMMLPIDTFRRLRRKITPYVDMCIPKTFTASVLMPSLQSLLSS